MEARTEEEIKELAYKRYGSDPHSFGGQRDGFQEGYKMCQESQPDLICKLKEAEEIIKWYMENTTPDNNDYQTFHDLGMNFRANN